MNRDGLNVNTHTHTHMYKNPEKTYPNTVFVHT